MNADSGQGQLFRTYVTSRLAVWTIVAGAVAGIAIGASSDKPLLALATLAGVALMIVGVAWVTADRVAARNFYWGFATSVGLNYANKMELLPLTPLLGAGDRRSVEHWMYGRLPGELSGGVGQLVWMVTERDRDGDRVVKERNRFTVCVVDLEASLSLFHGVFLRGHRGVIAPYSEWLPRSHTHSVELESTEFEEKYELRAADDQDEILLRRLLSPTLVNWLANHPLDLGFELKAGTLCVFVPRPLEDAGNITYLIDAARHLAQRVAGVVEEERTRVARA
jgi:hypothetical protein